MIEGQEGVSWQQWCDLADACEAHGVDTLFRSDHYISQSNETANVAHDAWTTLAGLAARTTTLRFGTLVSPATFRLPGLLANAAATVDHISGGRIELGLGAGWMEREHRAYGFPFPETSERLAHFAEQLEIVHRLWTEERVDFRGAYYTLEDAPAQPKPVQQPHPPILVGGSGTKGTAEPARASPTSTTRRSSRPTTSRAIRAKVEHACESHRAHAPLLDDDRLPDRRDARRRARACPSALRPRPPRRRLRHLARRLLRARAHRLASTRSPTRLREYEAAGCERVMLQHLLHADLEPVALIGRLRQQLA